MKLALLAVLITLVACGGDEGDEGDACSTSNSTDECNDGLVCTRAGSEAACRVLCDDPAVICPPGALCIGVSGGSHKSCQPGIAFR